MNSKKRSLSFDTHALRRTSTVESFPWLDRLVTLIRVDPAGQVTQATSDGQKTSMLAIAGDQDLVLAAWPGTWHQDVFVVDDIGIARMEVGLPRRGSIAGMPTSRSSASSQRHRDEPTATLDGDRPRQLEGGLWRRLIELDDVPIGATFEVAKAAVDAWMPDDAVVMFDRSAHLPAIRRVLVENASERLASKLIRRPECATADARRLLDRFPDDPDILDAALQRTDLHDLAWQRVTELQPDDALRLWEGGRYGPSGGGRCSELAWAVLHAVLSVDPPPSAVYGLSQLSDRRDRPNVIQSLLRHVPVQRQLEMARHPDHGPLVRQALLADSELPDELLLACLPEILKRNETESPTVHGATPYVIECLRRFPRLMQIAEEPIRRAVYALPAAGWSAVEAARQGRWDDLLIVAELTENRQLLDQLVRAAVHDRQEIRAYGPRVDAWRGRRRYRLVDLILTKRAITDNQIRYLLARLTDDHILDLQISAQRRSRLQRLCTETLAARATPPRTTPSTITATSHQQPRNEHLPTDKELGNMADPAPALLKLLRIRMHDRHRERAIDHALNSAYMTDDIAWHSPVQDLERHPIYGPRLATKIAEICGDSPRRWEELARSWSRSQPTQLLAKNLLKRLEDADD